MRFRLRARHQPTKLSILQTAAKPRRFIYSCPWRAIELTERSKGHRVYKIGTDSGRANCPGRIISTVSASSFLPPFFICLYSFIYLPALNILARTRIRGPWTSSILGHETFQRFQFLRFLRATTKHGHFPLSFVQRSRAPKNATIQWTDIRARISQWSSLNLPRGIL